MEAWPRGVNNPKKALSVVSHWAAVVTGGSIPSKRAVNSSGVQQSNDDAHAIVTVRDMNCEYVTGAAVPPLLLQPATAKHVPRLMMIKRMNSPRKSE